MNFFEHQDRAQRQTGLLIALLILAVAGLIVITAILSCTILFYFDGYAKHQFDVVEGGQSWLYYFWHTFDWDIIGIAALVIVTVVLVGSCYKWLQLGQGGKAVAEAMGGRLLNIHTRNAHEKKVLNVVEEMAIASGSPVPSVYLLDESSINAFAAGHNLNDAVIGITRGCVEQLSRDELQGVIAHEFSHIYHGDMRLNIRLVALLHGILLLGLIGHFLLRSTHYSHGYSVRRHNKHNNALPLLGLSLMVIGYTGTFFGNVIKAAVSRQREFLADASAVQFTRNPEGIGGALKKIGGSSSLLNNSAAAQFSHFYFSQGISLSFRRFMATHPPLQERIKRVLPNWNGEFIQVQQELSPEDEPAAKVKQSVNSLSSVNLAAAALASIGNPTSQNIDVAQSLIASLPMDLQQAAHEPYSARHIVYILLLDRHNNDIQKSQLKLVQGRDKQLPKHFAALKNQVFSLSRPQILPLLEVCIPALQALSPAQQQQFKRCLLGLIKADQKVSLFEWCVYRIVKESLFGSLSRERKYLKQLASASQMLLSIVCYAGKNTQPSAAFHKAIAMLDIKHNLELSATDTLKLQDLDTALDQLNQLRPLEKPKLLKAIGICIAADGKVMAEEIEIFRAIAASLNCPMPPLSSFKTL